MTLEQKISLLAKSAVKALYDVEATDAQILSNSLAKPRKRWRRK